MTQEPQASALPAALIFAEPSNPFSLGAARAAKRAARAARKAASKAFNETLRESYDSWLRRLRGAAFAFKPGMDPLLDAAEDGEEEGEEEGDAVDLTESWVRRLRFDGGDGPGAGGAGAGIAAA